MEFLTTLEEFDITRKIQFPHLMSGKKNDLVAKKKCAYLVLGRKLENLFLINESGFGTDAVIAGLTLEHMHHLALHAPQGYKENLYEAFENSFILKSVFEIAKDMDDDEGQRSTIHQKRVETNIQYFHDNLIAFKF